MRRKKRTKQKGYRTTLCSRPVRLHARLRDDRLRFFAWVWVPSARTGPGTIRVGLSLTKTQTQDFFCTLAEILGYALPTRKGAKAIPNFLLVETEKGLDLDFLVLGPKRSKSGTDRLAHARVTAPISRSSAQKLCVELADPLGWELHEWWE